MANTKQDKSARTRANLKVDDLETNGQDVKGGSTDRDPVQRDETQHTSCDAGDT